MINLEKNDVIEVECGGFITISVSPQNKDLIYIGISSSSVASTLMDREQAATLKSTLEKILDEMGPYVWQK